MPSRNPETGNKTHTEHQNHKAPGRPKHLKSVVLGDGPLSVRGCPSTVKGASRFLRKWPSVTLDRGVSLHPFRSETKGQAGACPDRTRATPCKVPLVTGEIPQAGNNRHARHERRRSRFNAPRSLTVANTAAKAPDNAQHLRTTLERRPSPRPATDGRGRCAHSYGSDAPRGKGLPVACPIGQ